MLQLDDVHTYYGQSYVLKGISFRIKQGSVAALLGRNGMGKSTIIRSISGLTPPRRGLISFKGIIITKLPDYQIARMGIGLIPQGRWVFPSLSVKENLTMGARERGKTVPWRLEKIYSLFPVLKERDKIRGNLLSGGEQQMLAIGRALMTNPDMLLMDEPSEGLSPMFVAEIGNIIRQLKESNLSILLVEQNLPMATDVADYVYVINKGVVVYESTTNEFIRNEDIKAKYIGVAG